jgi:hypothetical protein
LLLVDDIRQVGGGHRGAGMGTNSAPGGNIRPSTPRLGRVLRASRDFSIRGRLDQRHLRSADRGPGPGRQAFAAAANTSEHVDKPRGAAMNSASWVDLLAPRFGLCAQSVSASLARSASGSGYWPFYAPRRCPDLGKRRDTRTCEGSNRRCAARNDDHGRQLHQRRLRSLS